MGKKRKDKPAQSNTLLQFFAKNGSEETCPPTKRARQNSTIVKLEKQEDGHRINLKTEQEVIVIDSDDEDERKCSDISASSDVEVIEVYPSTRTADSKRPYNLEAKRIPPDLSPFKMKLSRDICVDANPLATVDTSDDSTVMSSVFDSVGTESTATTPELDHFEVIKDEIKAEGDATIEFDMDETDSSSCPICDALLEGMRHDVSNRLHGLAKY